MVVTAYQSLLNISNKGIAVISHAHRDRSKVFNGDWSNSISGKFIMAGTMIDLKTVAVLITLLYKGLVMNFEGKYFTRKPHGNSRMDNCFSEI